MNGREIAVSLLAYAASLFALFVAQPGLAHGQVARGDTTRTDTTLYVLEPLRVAVERERSAPPPIATTRVPSASVSRTLAANPYDLLRRLADVEVHEQGQGPGFASSAVIRGFTSDHSADVLLVVDGVPVNMPIHGHGEGYADWNTLIPASVSSLRVIHGTASPLYGNFALGGVVEVFTAADAEGAGAALFGTSDADAGGWFRTGARGQSGGWFAATELRRDDGWRDNSRYWLSNGLLRGWRALGTGRLEGGIALYGSDWDSPGFVAVPQYNREELEPAMDPTDGGDTRRVVLHGRYAAPLSREIAVQATAWGMLSRWRLFLNIPGHGDALSQTGEEDERVAVGGQVELSVVRPFGEMTAGVEGRVDRAGYWLARTASRAMVAGQVDLDARYGSAATYLRWRRTFGGRLGLDLGGRLDAFRYASLDRLEASPAWQEDVSWIASPKLGARYQLSRDLALLATSSRGFRGAVGVIEDPGRPAITAWAHEVGIELQRGPLGVHLAFFRLDVSNERTLDPVTREISSTGTSTRQGIDVDATYQLAPAWKLALSGTFNDARLSGAYADAHEDHDHEHSSAAAVAANTASSSTSVMHHPEDTEGEWVPGVARYTGRAAIDGVIGERLRMRTTFRLTGPYVPIGEPEVRSRVHSIIDLGADIRLTGRTWLDVELQNVAGIKYAELRASGYVNPGRPRTLRVAIRLDEAGF